jgi:hypothetical protein
MRTGNLAVVMRTMGHKDVKTAMQYQHPEPEIVRAALDLNTASDSGVWRKIHGAFYGALKKATSASYCKGW